MTLTFAPDNPFAAFIPQRDTVEVPDSPADLGFDPLMFPGWRPGQREVIQRLTNWALDFSPGAKRFYMLEAPTGIGKSLIAAAVLEMVKRNTPGASFYGVVSTITRNLQTQYMSEALATRAVSAWGRGNHQCDVLGPGADPADAPCSHGFRCPIRSSCSYYIERDAAHLGPIAVLNSAFYITGVNYVRVGESLQTEERGANLFGGASLVIHDEAHLLEAAIRNMIEVRLYRDFWEEVGYPLPRTSDYGQWQLFLSAAADEVKRLADRYATEARNLAKVGQLPDDPLGKRATQQNHARETFEKELLPHHPLINHEPKYVQARPIWGAPFGEQYLWQHSGKHLLMSATIPHPKYTAGTLGIEDGEYIYESMPSPFPIMSRRIVFEPVVKMNARTTPAQFNKIIARMDELLDKHPSQKGIIHSVSYQRARDIIAQSRHAHRMVTHTQGRGQKEDAIERFLAAGPGAILVSPSVGVGEDFGRGDNCRFQFFIKWPIPYLGDPVIKARTEQNPDSLWVEADMAFIQMVGRGTRSADDWCVNYVLDTTAGFRFRRLPVSIQQTVIRRTSD